MSKWNNTYKRMKWKNEESAHAILEERQEPRNGIAVRPTLLIAIVPRISFILSCLSRRVGTFSENKTWDLKFSQRCSLMVMALHSLQTSVHIYGWRSSKDFNLYYELYFINVLITLPNTTYTYISGIIFFYYT
jgi:hypothetical protein